MDYSSATQAVVVDLPCHVAIGAQIGTDTLSSIENVKTGSGNDAVAGDGATNVLDGGAGIDTVSYYAVFSGVVLDLAGQTGVDGTSIDTLLNFENANGTRFNDAISGTAAANVLDGLGGIDTISYYLSIQSVLVDLAGNVAIQGGITDTIFNFENVNGSAYNDAISGDAGANVLNGLGGIDTISYYASAQGVTIDLAAGTAVSGGVTDTLLNFENANGSVYAADVIIGNGGANVLNGLGGRRHAHGRRRLRCFRILCGAGKRRRHHRLRRQRRGRRRRHQARRLRRRCPGRDVHATQRHAVANPLRTRPAQRDHYVEQRSCRSYERFLLRVIPAAALAVTGRRLRRAHALHVADFLNERLPLQTRLVAPLRYLAQETLNCSRILVLLGRGKSMVRSKGV